MRISRRTRRQESSRRVRQRTTSTAEMSWEVMVASATPATPMWNTMTVTRLRATLTMPAAERIYRGRLVSPTARRMAAPKL